MRPESRSLFIWSIGSGYLDFKLSEDKTAVSCCGLCQMMDNLMQPILKGLILSAGCLVCLEALEI